jgi:hypothetical protein
VENLIARSQRWWQERRWTRTGWALRRGLGNWFSNLQESDVTAFFDQAQHQGPVVYAWGPDAGGNDDVYVGSSITAMFAGASKSDRVWSHLHHVRQHLRRECPCTNKLYRTAAAARAVEHWVLVPLVILPPSTETRALRRVELKIIKMAAPRLNTVGVTWTGRDARGCSGARRQRPAHRRRGRGRHQGVGVSAAAIANQINQPATTVRWTTETGVTGEGGWMTHDLLSWVRAVRDARAAGRESDDDAWCIWSSAGAASICATNWVTVRKKFGLSVVTVWYAGAWHVTTLAEMKRVVRYHPEGMLRLGRLQAVATPRRRVESRWSARLVRAVGLHHYSKLALVYGCRDTVLLQLWKQGLAKMDAGGKHVIQIVKRLMLRRHGLRVKQNYILRVPTMYNKTQVKRELQSLLRWCLRRRGLPACWAEEVVDRLRIVFFARPSVGHLLDNHMDFAKQFRVDTPFPCTCQDHPVRQLYRGARPIGDHVRIKLSECGSEVMERVSSVGSGFIPRPGVLVATSELLSGITACGGDILAAGSDTFMSNWGAEGRRRIRSIVASGCVPHPGGTPLPTTAVHLHEVQRVKQLLQGLVISPLDRNGKERVVECQRSYYDGYRDTFFNAHYEERHETETQILHRWTNIAEQKGWTRLFKLPPPRSQKLPGTAYTMRKNKDFALDSPHSAAPRCRPLTPYGGRGKLRHPLWKHMKVAGAVLRLALEDAGLRCWHLQSTGAFATGLLADHDHLAHAGAPGGRTVLFAFDLVKMFTNLDTSAVLRAVTWILFSNSGWERARSAAGRGSRYPRGRRICIYGSWALQGARGLWPVQAGRRGVHHAAHRPRLGHVRRPGGSHEMRATLAVATRRSGYGELPECYY